MKKLKISKYPVRHNFLANMNYTRTISFFLGSFGISNYISQGHSVSLFLGLFFLGLGLFLLLYKYSYIE